MLDSEPTGTEPGANDTTTTTDPAGDAGTTRPRRRRAASRPAGPPAPVSETPDTAAAAPTAAAPPTSEDAPAVAKKATRKRATKKAAAPDASVAAEAAATATAEAAPAEAPAADEAPVKPARRTRKRTAAPKAEAPEAPEPSAYDQAPDVPRTGAEDAAADATAAGAPAFQSAGPLFQAPEPTQPPARRSRKKAAAPVEQVQALNDTDDSDAEGVDAEDAAAADGEGSDESGPRRRRRGGRGRRGRGRGEEGAADESGEPAETAGSGRQSAAEDESAEDDETGEGGTRRRRRRRRRGAGEEGDAPATTADDPPNTVVRVREPRKSTRSKSEGDGDGVRAIKGSTRLEAKKQRRREGREAGRRRPSIITEAEFLARRESVHRTMIVRQNGERTQIAVTEDGVLVEHYVTSATNSALVGNVYLGKVQNVLPSMEAAFVDVGKGRNAVLYAGEVNWDAAGMEGQPKRIEQAMKSGDAVLVQVTKDPIGQKGARLTSQVSLAGRYLVYVPNGSMTGISRKLPENERARLKGILKKVVPDGAGVIVRTAAEGATEEELGRDVTRLAAQWEDIEKKAAKSTAPALLYGEPDLTIRVVRDIFNEDFAELIVSGDDAWDMLHPYVEHVAPDLVDRMSRWSEDQDVFAANRVDEQLGKALDRKVWLPSGGYLVIDRTEAMVVVDVNTGKFTGSGGNLEETVTKNNLEAAEEIVRQLRLRDLGGIIVIDFIDMVLESNRDLVLRRLTECLGRDRTKHQVAEVTSLGLVQMTRKRVGAGLIEVFSEECEHCNGRGIIVSADPIDRPAGGDGPSGGSGGGSGSGGSSSGNSGGNAGDSGSGRGSRSRRGRGRDNVSTAPEPTGPPVPTGGPTPAQIAAAAHAAAIQA
ncbi:MAG: ribonuclease, partial [Actinomycetota bacterium]|nr:ribonuclease [Actinomycetota bacterium]